LAIAHILWGKYFTKEVKMNIKFYPPTNHEEECSWLEQNFRTCLKEKALKDEVPKMNCKVENILWFMTECPNRFSKFQTDKGIRKAFLQSK